MINQDITSGTASMELTHTSTWWQRLLRHRLALIALAVLLIFLGCAILAPLLTPYSPDAMDLMHPLTLPSLAHPLGTDDNGRDLLSRCLYGGRISLAVGIVAMLVAMSIGITSGAISGYFGGLVDNLVMRIVDVMLAVPGMFMLIVASTIFTTGELTIMIVIGIFSWMAVARLVRGEILSVKQREYVEAARALGAGNTRIIVRHILPNIIGTIMAQATLTVGQAVLTESTLSYLGLGIQPPTPTWGNLLHNAQEYMIRAPWLVYPPGILIASTVLCFFIVGSILRDVIDPHVR